MKRQKLFKIYLKNVKKPLKFEVSEKGYNNLLKKIETSNKEDLIEIGPISFLKENYLYGIYQ